MAIDEHELTDSATRLLESAGEESLEGLEAGTTITILNTTVATSDDFVLGERVEFRIVGYVCERGDKLLENEGTKHFVKVKSNLIEVVADKP